MDQIRLPINEAQIQPPFEFGLVGRPQYTYLWIVVFSCIIAVGSGMGMGANDVSSSFSSTVGSRTLSVRSALVLSAISQVLGAYFLGARVTKTVGKSVVNLATFEDHLDLLMTGMMVVLIMTAIAVLLATSKGFPISTTQCIISTIIGFGVASPGAGINWNQVLIIFLSWIISPIITATLSGLAFSSIRTFILRKSDPLPKVLLLLPLLTWITIAVNLFFVLFVSPLASRLGVSVGVGIGVCIAIGAPFALLLFLLRNRLKASIMAKSAERKKKANDIQMALPHSPLSNETAKADTGQDHLLLKDAPPGIAIFEGSPHVNIPDDQAERQDAQQELGTALLDTFNKASLVLAHTDHETRQTVLLKEIRRILHIHDKKHTSSDQTTISSTHEIRVRRLSSESISHLVAFEGQQKYFDEVERRNPQLHQHAEQFDDDAEDAFRYLQIFTSVAAAFAQGANSIGNITGPLSVIVSVYETASFVSGDTIVDEWVTWLGIGSLLCGLFALGYIVLTSVAVGMIHVSPSRGFSISLSSSTILAIGSFIGLPLSTTHCVIGAITGVGLVEKPYSENGEELSNLSLFERLTKVPVKWRFIAQVIASWFLTVAFGITFGAGLFSFITFSPSQIYPLSAQNCLFLYAIPLNQTNATYCVAAPPDGFVQGIVGFSNNTVVPLT